MGGVSQHLPHHISMVITLYSLVFPLVRRLRLGNMITIKIPPSINHLYGNSKWGGKYVKPEGKAWFYEMQYLLQSSPIKNKIITKECALHLTLFTARYRDIDNILKAVFDVLQRAQVVENDNLIAELHLKRVKVKKIAQEKIEFDIFEL